MPRAEEPIGHWSWPRIWLISLGAGAVMALLQVTHGYIGFSVAGETAGGVTLPAYEATWLNMLTRTLPTWIWTGSIAPTAIWVARRFPLAPDISGGNILIHVLGSATFAMAIVVGAATLRYVLFLDPADASHQRVVAGYYALYFNNFFVYYWTIVGVYSMARYYRQAQARGAEKLELQASATQARLDALRRQLHPHFLFNILSAISSLVLEGERRDAVRALSDLSELLRVSFSRNTATITLREELEFLDLYIDLHRLRLEDRLRILYDIDPRAEEAIVPTFLLQPLVENAIEHGVALISEGGTVRLEVRVLESMLETTISNPLPRTPGRRTPSSGVGLAITRERVERSYGGRGSFEFAVGTAEAVARVIIPLSYPAGRSSNGSEDSYAYRRRRAGLPARD